jgi:hypothetical protein
MVKIIHYFWFGGNPLPPKTLKCIESWKKFFPDFEIKLWDESNFDINCNQYVREAYNAKKWAFVSDYARFNILEKYGGMYFDTDVEVIRPFDDLLENDAFAGFETSEYIAPGLVLWSKNPNHPLITEARKYYDNARFLDDSGERIKINVCGIFTSILKSHGFEQNNQLQTVCGMTLYPTDYFNPFDDATGLLHKTENTYSIHWYDKSWMPKSKIIRNKFTRILHRYFGTDIRQKLGGKK